jgi:AHBA synthesis associated protein
MNRRGWPTGPLCAVVFDLDGVLADSLEVMRRAFTAAHEEVVGAGEAPFNEYRTYMGLYFPEILRRMGLPPEMEDPFVRVSAELASEVPVYDGVRPMLAQLRAHGLRLAVATGKSGARARTLLRQLKLIGFFDAVVGSDEVARPKPAPDIVVRALASAGALGSLGSLPGAAAMVGDAPADMRSAHAAHVVAIAALWGTDDKSALLAARPDAIAYQPSDVTALCLPASELAS